jgi:transcriptional regulator with XRE-family HTH domain
LIGYKIKQLREAAGLTQSELSEKTGINVNTLATYERETREPNIDKICLFAEFFNVSTDYLLGRTPFQNDVDAAEAREQAGDISALLSRMRPEVRGGLLAALERLLLDCSDGVSDSSFVILRSFAAVVEQYARVKGLFDEWVSIIHEMARELGEADYLHDTVENGFIINSFKGELADCSLVIRKESDSLSESLSPIIDCEQQQALEVARMNALAGTVPLRVGEEVGDGVCD